MSDDSEDDADAGNEEVAEIPFVGMFAKVPGDQFGTPETEYNAYIKAKDSKGFYRLYFPDDRKIYKFTLDQVTSWVVTDVLFNVPSTHRAKDGVQ